MVYQDINTLITAQVTVQANYVRMNVMEYLQNSLLKNEKLIYWTRPHWIVFAPATAALVLGVAFLIYGPSYLVSGLALYGYSLSQLAALFCFACTVFFGLSALITFRTTEYGITDKRVLMKTGWIMRNSLEIFLEKVEAIHVDQSILGRILTYGTLSVIGTGGTNDPFANVPKPMLFRKRVQQQIDIDQQKAR